MIERFQCCLFVVSCCHSLRIVWLDVHFVVVVCFAPATTVEDLILLLQMFDHRLQGARLNHARGQDPVEIFFPSHRRQGGGLEGT
jgi:hypothetical protein